MKPWACGHAWGVVLCAMLQVSVTDTCWGFDVDGWAAWTRVDRLVREAAKRDLPLVPEGSPYEGLGYDHAAAMQGWGTKTLYRYYGDVFGYPATVTFWLTHPRGHVYAMAVHWAELRRVDRDRFYRELTERQRVLYGTEVRCAVSAPEARKLRRCWAPSEEEAIEVYGIGGELYLSAMDTRGWREAERIKAGGEGQSSGSTGLVAPGPLERQ